MSDDFDDTADEDDGGDVDLDAPGEDGDIEAADDDGFDIDPTDEDDDDATLVADDAPGSTELPTP
ncbi:MAG: hypothetical protein JWL72_2628 [Ilumatobacteraceae bacterium]|nr:hypothetical protein [Ilumatobacteraceae bacterium]